MTASRLIVTLLAGALLGGCASATSAANPQITPTVHPLLAMQITVVPYRSGAMEPNDLLSTHVTATPSLLDSITDFVGLSSGSAIQEITATPDPFYDTTPSPSPAPTATRCPRR